MDGRRSEVDSELPRVLAGRYALETVVGRGATAEVFRAHDDVLGRPVAIKMFPPTPSPTDPVATGTAGPVQEARTLAGLAHPGLVTLHDLGEDAGRTYLVMQLVEGSTLADRIAAHPLSPAGTARLGAVVADALSYLHEHGIVHRDVKPANVLLDAHGRPHLADFGIATPTDTLDTTSTDVVAGTPAYLAPEQVLGHPARPAGDVYALGLVLLECLTGTREYDGSPTAAAAARLHRAPRIPPGAPGALAGVLAASTDLDPARRPTAAGVAARLRALDVAPTGRPGGDVAAAVTAPHRDPEPSTLTPAATAGLATTARVRRPPPAPAGFLTAAVATATVVLGLVLVLGALLLPGLRPAWTAPESSAGATAAAVGGSNGPGALRGVHPGRATVRRTARVVDAHGVANPRPGRRPGREEGGTR